MQIWQPRLILEKWDISARLTANQNGYCTRISAMFEYTCQYCHKAFLHKQHPNCARTPRYCSTQCYYAAKRKHQPINCIVCGKVFTPAKSGMKHCSKECSYVSHRQRAVIQCAHCGKTFSRRRGMTKYCSQECYGNSMLSHFPRKGKEFSKAVRRAIRKRDNHACVICGSTRNLELDHIIPISLGGENSIENGQTLCHKCHRAKSLSQRKFILRRGG